MSFRDLDFRVDYNKDRHDIASEFYLPCMNNSLRYDRLTGFFSSYVFSIAWESLPQFVQRGGKLRVICSSNLSCEDIEAISEGYNSRGKEVYEKALRAEIGALLVNPRLSKPTRLLSCLVGLNVASFKIAVIVSKKQVEIKRMFHDKVGVFTDSLGDSVVFRGSMNESFTGLSSDGNIESISVYKSWDDNNDATRAKNAKEYFEHLWSDLVPGISVIDFSDTIVESTREMFPDDNWQSLLDETLSELVKEKKWVLKNGDSVINPFPHQWEALQNWELHGRRGILEHATGSGKTITGICAINDAHRRGETAIVLVPSLELLKQWHGEIRKTLPEQVRLLVCGGQDMRWKCDRCLESWTQINEDKPRIILSTIGTASSDEFLNRIRDGKHIFLLVDEVHRVGSPKARHIFSLDTGPRLGLSATPKRFGDPEGTNAILEYFDGIIPPPFTIADAIRMGVLTKYFYTPHTIRLQYEEQDNWTQITSRINKFLAQNKDSDQDILNNDYLKSLLIARARIIKNAVEKTPLALKVLEENYVLGQRWIVYCDNQVQMNSILDLINSNGYNACEYHSSMQGDRYETMRHFRQYGGILVSIKCLDEGVDIPAATHALILASSQNPREFIQRRGRILRKAENKHYAFLHDAIVLPQKNADDGACGFVTNELARCREFAKSADNPSCLSKIDLIALENDIDLNENLEGGFEDE